MIELEPFLLRALAAALALAVVAAPLGSLVIWNRMAYFGEDARERATPDATGEAVAFLLGPDAAALRGRTLDLRPASAG